MNGRLSVTSKIMSPEADSVSSEQVDGDGCLLPLSHSWLGPECILVSIFLFEEECVSVCVLQSSLSN